MALRTLWWSAVVGLAALGALHAPPAQARGSVSISIGTPSPYYQGGYRGGYADGYGGGYSRGHVGGHQIWVPGHWVATYRGRAWVPGQYVRASGHGNFDRGYGYDPRVIQRSGPDLRPLPGGFYYQRGGEEYPPDGYLPRVSGW